LNIHQIAPGRLNETLNQYISQLDDKYEKLKVLEKVISIVESVVEKIQQKKSTVPQDPEVKDPAPESGERSHRMVFAKQLLQRFKSR